MTLIWALLPVYIFGNVHCFGMCGPLVMMIGQHRYRSLYYLGRLCSYTLAGFISGSLGFVLQGFLTDYYLAASLSMLFGLTLISIGLSHLANFSLPRFPFIDRPAKKLSQSISYLILQDKPLSTALFGFFTVFLPCGQTLIVFSALALVGDPVIGAINGFVFAGLTSPSLWMAMSLSKFLARYKKISSQMVGLSALLVGSISCLRALAELNLIPHLTLSEAYHFIIY